MHKKVALIFSAAALFIIGCASAPTEPAGVSVNEGSTAKIKIIKPAANDSIGYTGSEIIYTVEGGTGLKFIELYINGEYKSTFFPLENGNKPQIAFELDSINIGKRISCYLKYYDNNNTSASSDTIKNLIITEERSMPSIPFDVKVLKISETAVNLSWKDTSKGETAYEIYRKTGHDGEFEFIIAAKAGIYNINDETVQSGINYFYKIRGVNKYGFSEFSNIVNTIGSGGSSNVPAPTQLTSTVKGLNVVCITWKDNTNDENYFAIERRTDFTGFERIGIAERNMTTFTDSANGLAAGGEYYYRVKVITSSDSSWSKEVSVVLPLYILAPPTLLNVNNIASTQVEVTWKDNDSRWTEWEVERKTGKNGFFEKVTTLQSQTTVYIDNAVVPGIHYYYRVRAYDGSNYSEYSNEIEIITAVIPLSVPQNVTVQYHPYYSMELNWSYVDNINAVFIIERRIDQPGEDFIVIGETGVNVKQYLDLTTSCQVTYSYRIYAKDKYSKSNYSNSVSKSNTDNCP